VTKPQMVRVLGGSTLSLAVIRGLYLDQNNGSSLAWAVSAAIAGVGLAITAWSARYGS